MGISTTEDTRAERISAGDPRTRTEVKRPHVSPGAERASAFPAAADEPQTADQRLPLLVVLLASFFLLGVSAGWQPAEPNGQAASPQLATGTRTVDATQAAPTNSSALPERTHAP